MANRLNNEFFGKLFKKLDGFKKQAVELKKKKVLESGIVKQPPCCVCGRWFGSQKQNFIIVENFKPELHCPTCKKNLADGYTALVSLDNRFAFVKFPAASKEQAEAVAGKVMTITKEKMDAIQASGTKVDNVENN